MHLRVVMGGVWHWCDLNLLDFLQPFTQYAHVYIIKILSIYTMYVPDELLCLFLFACFQNVSP